MSSAQYSIQSTAGAVPVRNEKGKKSLSHTVRFDA